jgi:hypothetical protein
MRRETRAGLRALAGFLVALAVWFTLSRPYEKALALFAEPLIRAFENPPATRLSAHPGEIVVTRSDWPPAAPSPGLPSQDVHFNFVLLVALFAADRGFWRLDRVVRFGIACFFLSFVHVTALVFDVQALYATRLGAWSQSHFGPVGRNFWAGGYHFYLIAGRFAAPFAIWWPLRAGRSDEDAATARHGGRRSGRRVRGSARPPA